MLDTNSAIILIGTIAGLALAFFIVWKAKRNSLEDAMTEENPRRAWYQLGCKGCQRPTPHGSLTDGLCPDCSAKADAEADIRMETTPLMLHAGAEALKASAGETDMRKAALVFRAMLKAMPLEQKRALLRNPLFEVKIHDEAA